MVEFKVINPMTPAEITLEAKTIADFIQAQGDFYRNPLWLALNSKRVIDAWLSFYTVGDCQFASPGLFDAALPDIISGT